MISVSCLLISLLAIVGAKPVARDTMIHDRRDSVPSGFVLSGAAPADTVLNMRISLASDLSGLESALNAASIPSSSSYGQWLSKEDVEAFAKPSDETTSQVTSWLTEHGVQANTITPAGDWISFSVPVSKANEMFEADYSIFTHVDSGKTSVRTLAYSIPSTLNEHIGTVYPTTSFSGPLRGSPVVAVKADSSKIPASDAASCSSTITPACLQTLYGIPTAAANATGNAIGVVGFAGEYAIQADLTTFLGTYRKDMSSSTSFTFMSVDGGVNPQTAWPEGEANLDIQYTVGLATEVPVAFIAIGVDYQDGDDAGFLDVINALLAESAPPQVLTTSYGFDTESSLSKSLSVSLCNAYMQLTARGVSILFASGDGGVAANDVPCSKTFNPTFPTCPYVTLVGATGGVPEVGADLSAGGFSNYFPQASWQSTAVNAYLTTLGTEYSGKYNASGRAYPDISAIGESVEIIVSGSGEAVDGTSCSSPIFASVIGLLNDELLTAGKPVLGFLNPWLYANPGAFNDITSGSNPGCGTSGFPATAGWDPVTGLGSPNYAKMKAAAGL